MCKSINNKFSSNILYTLIDNVLYYHRYNMIASLSKNQSKLIYCLLRGQGKSKIIEFIWGGGDTVKNSSKYTQLILRTRNKLISSGFPSDTILTVAKYGVRLNETPSLPVDKLNLNFIGIDVESRVINFFHM